ncbi:MAG: hypothetical protein GXO86_10140 [Chlorobi bacterium]|nr:hypothetical protein [Chlorobiota bacterium]
MIRKFVLLLLLIGAVFSLHAFNPGYSGFIVRANGLDIPYHLFTVFVLPGETIDLSVNDHNGKPFDIGYSEGKLIREGDYHWKYIAPSSKGNHILTLGSSPAGTGMVLNVFVMVPASGQKGEYLNGYRIGKYPDKLFRNNPAYKKPEGFIEVTKENKELQISPHFFLKQFLCKQQPGQWPKYMVLNPKLIIKLELLLEKLNKNGLHINSLFVMSGYRSPYYNSSLGRGIYSRHIYGDAADIYVDTNNDKVIDDLNRDGKASMEDAVFLGNIIESMDKDPKYNHLIGGLGKYKKTSAHTWDIHVDTRGYKARW